MNPRSKELDVADDSHSVNDLHLSDARGADRWCDQQRDDWFRGHQYPVEFYLQRSPELSDHPTWLLDLIYGEVLLRQEIGQPPILDEYCARFPDLTEPLSRMFEVHSFVEGSGAFGPQTRADEDTKPSNASAQQPSIFPDFQGYKLLEPIGRGGMGVVYRARQDGTDREVAVKIFHGGMDLSAEERSRFSIEAQASARLRHPSIVSVHEAGCRDGVYFLAMDYIDGQTLANQLENGPVKPRQAAELIELVAEAVHYAHTRDVIHRDLKPQNVLLDQSGHPFVADFGLAHFRDRQSTFTTGGQILGTIPYMSPEQAGGETSQTGTHCDVYGLGAVLYHMLTGRPPHHDASVPQLLDRLLNHEPVRPSILNDSIPRDLETICLKCLRKEPESRYETARDLAEDLRRYLDGRSVMARPLPIVVRVWRLARRKPWISGLVTLSVMLLVFSLFGSMGAAIKFRRDGHALSLMLQRAEDAEYGSKMALIDARIAQAEMSNKSLGQGRRWESLRLVDDARSLGRNTALRHDRDRNMRNQLVAALSNLDVQSIERPEHLGASGVALESATVFGPEDVNLHSDSAGRLHGRRISPSGKQIAEWGNGEIRVRDAADHSLIHTIRNRATQRVLTLDWRQDESLIAVGSADHFAYVFESCGQSQPVMILNGAHSQVNRVRFSPDNLLMASSRGEERTRLYDTETGDVVMWFEGVGLEFDAAGTMISGTRGGMPARWALRSSELHWSLRQTTGSTLAVAGDVSPDGSYMLLAGWDEVCLWSLPDRRRLGSVKADLPHAVMFDSNDRAVVLDQQGIRVVRLVRRGGGMKLVVDHEITEFPVEFCANTVPYVDSAGLFAVASETDGHKMGVSLAQLNDGKLENLRKIDVSGVTRSRLSPDERFVAVTTEALPGVDVFDVQSGEKIARVATESEHPRVIFDSSGQQLIVADGRSYRLIDTGSNRQISVVEFEAPSSIDVSMACSPDGRLLAVSHQRGAIDLIDLQTARRVVELPIRQNGTWLRFSPDGQTLLCRDEIFRFRAWDVAQIRKQCREHGLDW